MIINLLRAAVADVIHDQSSTAQFITTTFRPELLSRADKHFGVLFRGKASSILTVERESAVKFVEEEVVTINEQL